MKPEEKYKKEIKLGKKYQIPKPPGPNEIHNPVKEGIKTSLRFLKIFWAIIILAIIIFLLVRYGSEWGIELNW